MNIYAKLLEARKSMSFEKEFSSSLKYDTLSADKVLEMVGDALANQGILFVPSMIDAQVNTESREKTYQNGDTVTQYVQMALATIEITFIDVEDGQTLTATTHGSASDYGDKALGKAQTYAIKYFFARMFLKGKDDFNDEEDMSGKRTPEPHPTTKTAPKSSGRHSDKSVIHDMASDEDLRKIPEWLDCGSAKMDLTRLRNKSATFWGNDDGPLNYAHVYNRILIICGVPEKERKGQKTFPKFFELMQEHCKLTGTELWSRIQTYEPQSAPTAS